MKSYNHLWEQFISDDNIDLAIKNASQRKIRKHDKNVQKGLKNGMVQSREFKQAT